jgi:hypothetical protein
LEACKDLENMLRSKACIFVVVRERRGGHRMHLGSLLTVRE